MATTNVPSTAGEIQLFKVLERSNLLQYYDNFIAQGGDDVQQLCEAEEGEFFEIMELVGMASKPLHVRRLQKALQEWITTQGVYQEQAGSPSVLPQQDSSESFEAKQSRTTSPSDSTGSPASQMNPAAARTFASLAGLQQYNRMTYSPKLSQGKSPSNPAENATMSEEHVDNVRKAAILIAQDLDMSTLPMPKKIPPEMAGILEMALEDLHREPEIRKWAPIYGRFDSKRKSEKPLSLHEVTVNEAACQLCLIEPHLLFMRDRLFPLSRQVVRESGYQYKHGHSSRSTKDAIKSAEEDSPAAKRPKLIAIPSTDLKTRTVQAELMKIRREERMNEITTMLSVIKERQSSLKDKISEAKMEEDLQRIYDLQIELEKLTSQQLLLMTEQTDLIKRQRRSERYYVAKAKAADDDGREESEYLAAVETREGPLLEEFASSSIPTLDQSTPSAGNGVYTVNPTAPPHDSQYMNGSYGTEANYETNSGQESPRTASPRPEGGRISRRKGTPAKNNQDLHKQTLIDEGLRLAAVYNADGELDFKKEPTLSLHNLKEEEVKAVDAILGPEEGTLVGPEEGTLVGAEEGTLVGPEDGTLLGPKELIPVTAESTPVNGASQPHLEQQPMNLTQTAMSEGVSV